MPLGNTREPRPFTDMVDGCECEDCMTGESQPASPTGGIAPTNPLRCPIHHLPDCSPLLNGCSLVIELATYPRGTVDAAIEGVFASEESAQRYADERNADPTRALGRASVERYEVQP